LGIFQKNLPPAKLKIDRFAVVDRQLFIINLISFLPLLADQHLPGIRTRVSSQTSAIDDLAAAT